MGAFGRGGVGRVFRPEEGKRAEGRGGGGFGGGSLTTGGIPNRVEKGEKKKFRPVARRWGEERTRAAIGQDVLRIENH